MATFTLTIVSPQGKVFEGDAESLIVPGFEGEMGVLAHHAPMIAFLKLGVTKVKTGAGPEQVFVTGEAVLEVERNEVNVLADLAVKADSVEAAKTVIAEETKKRAESAAAKA